MEKKELTNILNEILILFGFKKKGNFWIINENAITKMVNLQKSQFGNRFYINYGFIIKDIPLENLMMHVFNGFGSIEVDENTRIKDLLDLENEISNKDRINELKQMILLRLIPNIEKINTEEDLLNELRRRPHLNDIPLSVKKYFNLNQNG